MNVSIRAFCEADISNKVRWINDERNNQYLHYELPLEEEKTRQWFLRNRGRTNRYDGVIVCDGVPVGVIGLLQISQGRGEYYIALGEPDYLGKGIAKAASLLLLDYAQNKLGLHEIYLYTETENTSAQALFERLGFQKQGIEKNSAQNRGNWVDRYYYTLKLVGETPWKP